ncbi:hypothetical protein [Alicyclobacillus sp.]|uniref:hypothetical protein n=1 Tax=Alicyclobacillus sp. TaxID=61169 RepID=UPI0025B96896|nr:hypothetical protein [Alicyclobacillus sp.]MCL6517338.1 hypothetical protein [Alicyclobacillus sp.]
MGDHASDLLLTAAVLYGLFRLLGPRVRLRRPVKRSKRRTVRVDPLIARERRLAAELRLVRAQIQERDGGTRLSR